MITYTFKLDMTHEGLPLKFGLKQYDSDFTLVFNLYSRKGTLNIMSGTTVKIRGTKPDGRGYSVSASLTGSTVTVTGDQQMTAVAGLVPFELTLVKSGKELNTTTFYIHVERAALDLETIPSESKIKEIYELAETVDDILEAAASVESAVESIANESAMIAKNKEVNDIQQGLLPDLYTKRSDIAVNATTSNYALKGDGTRKSDANSELKTYVVTAGDVIYLSLAGDGDCTYQWQNSATVPTSGIPTALIGTPVSGAVDTFVRVPTGATRLIVSKLKTTSTNIVKATAARTDENAQGISALNGRLDEDMAIPIEQSNYYDHLINYGYNQAYDLPIASGSGNQVGVKRFKTLITLNTSGANSAGVYIRLDGEMVRTGTVSDITNWTGGIPLVDGHIYEIVVRYLSGSSVLSNALYVPVVAARAIGTASSPSISAETVGNEYHRTFKADDQNWLFFVNVSKNANLSNAKFLVTVCDLTAEDSDFSVKINTLRDDNYVKDMIVMADESQSVYWTIGGLGSGGENYNRAHAIRSTFIDFVDHVELDNDYVASVCFYKANETFVKRVTGNTGVIVPKKLCDSEYYYIRIELTYAPGGTTDTTTVTDTTRSEHVHIFKPTVTKTLMERVIKFYDDKNYSDLLYQTRYGRNPLTAGSAHESSSNDVITLLLFSDVHGNVDSMMFAMSVYETFSDRIDDVLHTGDAVVGLFDQDISDWASICGNKVLNVIGNHDSYQTNGAIGSAGKTNIYNKFFAPFIGNWNVTQPDGVSNSASPDYCALYYYKDYAKDNIRLIVLDTNCWDSAESAWLTATLASAKTSGYAVLIACHAINDATGNRESYFCWDDRRTENASNCAAPLNWLDPVNDFVNNGGEIIGVLAGHSHCTFFGTLTQYPDIMCYIQDKAGLGRTYGATRVKGEKNQNTVSLITINKSAHRFMVVRIGAEVNRFLAPIHALCYNYQTQTILAQW